MDRNLVLGTQWLLLAAAIGTYGAVTGLTFTLPIAAVVALPSIWYVSRGSVTLSEFVDQHGEPDDYSTLYYTGLVLSTMGVLGFTQASEGMIYQSLAGVLAGLGGTFVVGGIYEEAKRGVAS